MTQGLQRGGWGRLKKHTQERSWFLVFSFRTNIATDNSCAVGEVTSRHGEVSVILVVFFFFPPWEKRKKLIAFSMNSSFNTEKKKQKSLHHSLYLCNIKALLSLVFFFFFLTTVSRYISSVFKCKSRHGGSHLLRFTLTYIQ